MSVAIRLARRGAKKKPVFDVVAVPRANRRDTGNVLDRMGQYRPSAVEDKEKISLDLDKIKAWQAKGAKTSELVGQLVKLAEKSK